MSVKKTKNKKAFLTFFFITKPFFLICFYFLPAEKKLKDLLYDCPTSSIEKVKTNSREKILSRR